ncbi:NlpC/P60 family protein [Streptomyces sp. NPDC020875]|uniref:NlpC/P60 family protein n=1 Tax=Streptomyces sp. NPDC020875 TaxID=3154898 RepID=UPI00340B535B
MTALGAGTILPLVGPSPGAVAAPRPTAAGGTAALPPPEVTAGASRTSVAVAAYDPARYTRAASGALTVSDLGGTPARTGVVHEGEQLAVLTRGCRTVVLTGPERTFREDKRPLDDTFPRAIAQGGWGLSPGGGGWDTANGEPSDYSVVQGAGIVSIVRQRPGSRHLTLKDDRVADLDAVITGSFGAGPADAPRSLALTFGFQTVSRHCRARLAFTAAGAVTLRLEKAVSATSVVSLATAFPVSDSAPADSSWSVRVERTGTTIRARAWRADLPEPVLWQVVAENEPLVVGRIGVRADADSTTTDTELRISRVRILAATWDTPVTVSHRSWVRVLPQPFDGTWSAGVEERVRGWLGSTAPDALGYGWHFLPGAPRVASYRTGPPELGAPVLGTSEYGPPQPGGARDEGADFHEYMGVDWTFGRVPSGTLTKTADPRFAGALDCSGYIRMVFGYHLGVPLAHESDHTSPGLLPRRSADMAVRAPGAVIAQSAAAPPALTGLQPGDLVFFDAETDTGDVIDHVGMALGTDTAGVPRFLSSRKTPNGPTAADLGGASALTGTGTYATTLRTVRRL